MVDDLVRQLLEAGVHFGHQAKRWNPKMAKFIFGERSGIYIIDLEKTAKALKEARDFIVNIASKGGTFLFVGTKKQAQAAIKDEAKRCGMFFVDRRWLGGLLTNFQTVRKSVAHLKKLEKMRDDGTFHKLSKKEVSKLTKEMEKLEKNLSGVKEMENLPSVMFLIDSHKEETAVNEARILQIPIVGFIDTNCDPDLIDFSIPGNDDAMRSISFIAGYVADSIIEGRKRFLEIIKKPIEVPKEQVEEKTDEQTGEKIKVEDLEVLEEVIEQEGEDKKPVKPKADIGDKSKKPRTTRKGK
ncbi:MAG: 30S ribosomal protein S2 [Candidatus Omnitrophica bacterium]|nr:30S ribosomal protein S2 [Candidatus Omnitrophota bacterium]